MAPSGNDEDSAARVLLQQVIANPAVGRDRLVQVLGLLDADDRSLRLSAGWALSLVASEHEEMVEPIARRLVDRLADDDQHLETRHALSYLRYRYPEAVAETLATVAEAAAESEQRQRYLGMARSLTRNDYMAGPGLDLGTDRARLPGQGGDDPRSLYREEGNEIGGSPADATESGESEEANPAAKPGNEEADAELEQRRREVAELRQAASEARIEDIADRSRFDELTIVAARAEGRYSDVYRTRAVEGDVEQAIALRLVRTPDDDGGFTDALAERLRNWEAIGDHDDVVTLYDWGMNPDPWMATEYTTRTLYDRVDLSLEEAIHHALQVAGTISYSHQRGVVHTGLDPNCVVYGDTELSDRTEPLVGNVGLLAAFRPYVQPAKLLDPRYAAPEYFDPKFGDVDPATDIYHLGGVVYKLLTGRPPFHGSYDEVRAGVLGSTSPAPSSLNPEIPASLDDVVSKAMAKQKLNRYETANQLVSELKQEYEG